MPLSHFAILLPSHLVSSHLVTTRFLSLILPCVPAPTRSCCQWGKLHLILTSFCHTSLACLLRLYSAIPPCPTLLVSCHCTKCTFHNATACLHAPLCSFVFFLAPFSPFWSNIRFTKQHGSSTPRALSGLVHFTTSPTLDQLQDVHSRITIRSFRYIVLFAF